MLAKDIIFEGITSLYQHKLALLKALSIPMFLALLLVIVADTVTVSMPWLMVVVIMHLLLGAYIAIAVHRAILLKETTMTIQRRTFFGYIVCSLGILIIMAPAIAINLIPYIGLEFGLIPHNAEHLVPLIGLILALIFVSLTMAGYYLILPSAAINQSLSFVATWEISKNHFGTLFICVVLVVAIISIPGYLMDYLLSITILSEVYFWLTFIVNVAILSAAYRHIVNPNCGIISPDLRD